VLLLALPCACGGAETVGLVRDEFLVALPAGHPLGARGRIPAQALAHERLLLLEDGHCLRDQALVACDVPPPDDGPDFYAATSLHTLVQMVAGGLGVTLLPRIAVQAGVTAGTDVMLRPLAGRGAWRTLGLGWRPNAARRKLFEALAPVLRLAAAAEAEQGGAKQGAGGGDDADQQALPVGHQVGLVEKPRPHGGAER